MLLEYEIRDSGRGTRHRAHTASASRLRYLEIIRNVDPPALGSGEPPESNVHDSEAQGPPSLRYLNVSGHEWVELTCPACPPDKPRVKGAPTTSEFALKCDTCSWKWPCRFCNGGPLAANYGVWVDARDYRCRTCGLPGGPES